MKQVEKDFPSVVLNSVSDGKELARILRAMADHIEQKDRLYFSSRRILASRLIELGASIRAVVTPDEMVRAFPQVYRPLGGQKHGKS